MSNRFRGRLNPIAWAAMLCFLFAASVRGQTSIPPGTEVPLEFTEEVSTRTAQKGDVIHFRVYEDVRVNGRTMLRAGAPASGVVESVKHPGRFGKRGELKI